MAFFEKAKLVEYSLSIPPLALAFAFNPETITRNRTITVKTGGSPATRGGYDFRTPLESQRAAQGVEMQPESLQFDVLIDATDALEAGNPIAQQFGIQPQLDTLRSMIEPKTQGPAGLKVLASLQLGEARAFQMHETPSVLLLIWGFGVLPVFLTGVTQKEVMHLRNLFPIRAEVQLNMQVIESNNPFFLANSIRQTAMSALNMAEGFGTGGGG